ncbi:alpha/beta hydrolase [Aurantivibrio plasticivorans]
MSSTNKNSHSWQDVWCTSGDGLKLHARCYGERNETKPTILCIPGLTRNAADFHALAEHLSKYFCLFCVDLRGRGQSDYDTNPENYTPAVYMQDVLGMIDQLSLRNILLIGTSLGALVSMLMVTRQPQLFVGVVLNDFAPKIEAAGLKRIQSYVGKLPPVHDWQEAADQARLINGRECPGLSDDEWLAFARNLYRENEYGIPVFDYDPAISQPLNEDEGDIRFYEMWPVFDNLPNVPLLMLRGAKSDLVAASTVIEMERRKPSLAAVEVPNRGHAPLLNERVSLAAIDRFLLPFYQ